jgi:hypothetical protein
MRSDLDWVGFRKFRHAACVAPLKSGKDIRLSRRGLDTGTPRPPLRASTDPIEPASGDVTPLEELTNVIPDEEVDPRTGATEHPEMARSAMPVRREIDY